VTRIEEIINGGIFITPPEMVSGNTLLRNDLPVIVQIVRDDAAYQFHSRIRVSGSGETRRFILTPPQRMQRVQRRMFARVDVTTRIEYALIQSGMIGRSGKKIRVGAKPVSVDMSPVGCWLNPRRTDGWTGDGSANP